MTEHTCNYFRVEVVADQYGGWHGNGLEFDTRDEAEVYAIGLMARWTAVRDWRIVEMHPDGRPAWN